MRSQVSIQYFFNPGNTSELPDDRSQAHLLFPLSFSRSFPITTMAVLLKYFPQCCMISGLKKRTLFLISPLIFYHHAVIFSWIVPHNSRKNENISPQRLLKNSIRLSNVCSNVIQQTQSLTEYFTLSIYYLCCFCFVQRNQILTFPLINTNCFSPLVRMTSLA